MKRTTMLLIMDGYGLSPASQVNAISCAATPHLNRLFQTRPHTSLLSSGKAVGLPTGQMGNSEVGHLNMGAGRIVWQELTKINNAIEDRSFFENAAICSAMKHAKANHSALHLMGLLSDGGVHSHTSHLFALLDMAKTFGLDRVYVHAFLDGRDVPPSCGDDYIRQTEEYMLKTGVGEIASIMGRYYAMDRDNRWERVQKAYRALIHGEGQSGESAMDLLNESYRAGINDEFVLPCLIARNEKPPVSVADNDALIFFNFRPDRARELTRAFVDPDFKNFVREKFLTNLFYVCLTSYDTTMPNVAVAFSPQELNNTLGEYLSFQKKNQLRIAETEKYAHVTFFFNGGVEAPNPGEDRILIPSPQVDHYDLKPEMSAYLITDAVIEKIKEHRYDVIILNFANCDMVGHTGVFEATIKAVQVVDECVGRIEKAIIAAEGSLLITADHGNADHMVEEDGSIATAHSKAPVPLILVGQSQKKLADGGSLCDIAPTLLEIMGLPIPKEMTGQSLLRTADSAK